MTRPDDELVAAIRLELAAVEPARPCDRAAEAVGLASAPVRRRRELARLSFRLGREEASKTAPGNGGPGNAAPGNGGPGNAAPGNAVEEDGDDGSSLEAFDWSGSPEHCRLAWLRGVFLAHGSLSLAPGRAHLEFVVDPDAAPVLAERLAELGLAASVRSRRGRGVVTWKSAERIALFLRRIGAGPALLELEARQVARAVRGDLNRIVNAESANLERAVIAAGRQLAAIDALENDGRLARQPYVVRLVADGRRETPEATLSELAERLGIHRSAVQRALERIEELALHSE